jgi:Tryptophan-rich Synechocystis species C-terminal domain
MNGGYEVAWKLAGADSYTIWNTDSNGNYQTSQIAAVAGTNPTLEAAEANFQQDLNGDGVIGVPRTVIEAAGATDLVQVGGNYFLDNHGTSTGPELTYNGTPVTAGEFGGWMPIGAEAMNGGYEIAWKLAGSNSYTIWSADAAGHYQTNLLSAVPGTNTALESAETSFQQDLNGNGMIGTPASAGGTVTTSGADMLTVVTNPTPILIALGIRNGETAHISSPFDSAVVFMGSSGTLLLDHSSDFSGTVAGMSGQDTIDFADINFTTPQAPSYSGTSSGGTLTVTDGAHTANVALLGNYLASTFVASSDGHGGTSVIQVPSQSSANDSITHPQS